MPGRKSNMVTVNHNYLKLPGSYLFSTIGKKVKAYKEANPQANVISLGIGDVTQPLAPAIIEALHKSVDEMGDAATFHGRKWLIDNFETANEIWFVFPGKSSGKKSITYNDAVEEALCFEWIDSTIKSLDEEHVKAAE